MIKKCATSQLPSAYQLIRFQNAPGVEGKSTVQLLLPPCGHPRHHIVSLEKENIIYFGGNDVSQQTKGAFVSESADWGQ